MISLSYLTRAEQMRARDRTPRHKRLKTQDIRQAMNGDARVENPVGSKILPPQLLGQMNAFPLQNVPALQQFVSGIRQTGYQVATLGTDNIQRPFEV